jgi:hypothetical protein
MLLDKCRELDRVNAISAHTTFISLTLKDPNGQHSKSDRRLRWYQNDMTLGAVHTTCSRGSGVCGSDIAGGSKP